VILTSKLSSQFWKTFARKNWLGEPVVIPAPFSEIFLSERDILTALRAAFYLEKYRPLQRMIKCDSNTYLTNFESPLTAPNADDVSVEKYIKAQLKQNNLSEVFLNFKDFQSVLPVDKVRSLIHFLSGLFQHIGIQIGQTSTELFMGRYNCSSEIPYSLEVHKDDAHVFCFALTGRKKMRLWHKDCFGPGRPIPKELIKQRENSILLEAEPGEVISWPSDYWHVSESSGETIASLSVAIFRSNPLNKIIMNRLLENPEEEGRAILHHLPIPHPARSPRKTQGEITFLKRRLKEYERIKTAYILKQQSSWGLRSFPRRQRPQEWPPHAVVQLCEQTKIFTNKDRREFSFAANGYHFALPPNREIEDLIKQLNKGKALRIEDLSARYSRRQRRLSQPKAPVANAVSEILMKLYEINAIDIKPT
jgi:hypothetical protein